jgi:hypothetical protein
LPSFLQGVLCAKALSSLGVFVGRGVVDDRSAKKYLGLEGSFLIYYDKQKRRA